MLVKKMLIYAGQNALFLTTQALIPSFMNPTFTLKTDSKY